MLGPTAVPHCRLQPLAAMQKAGVGPSFPRAWLQARQLDGRRGSHAGRWRGGDELPSGLEQASCSWRATSRPGSASRHAGSHHQFKYRYATSRDAMSLEQSNGMKSITSYSLQCDTQKGTTLIIIILHKSLPYPPLQTHHDGFLRVVLLEQRAAPTRSCFCVCCDDLPVHSTSCRVLIRCLPVLTAACAR